MNFQIKEKTINKIEYIIAASLISTFAISFSLFGLLLITRLKLTEVLIGIGCLITAGVFFWPPIVFDIKEFLLKRKYRKEEILMLLDCGISLHDINLIKNLGEKYIDSVELNEDDTFNYYAISTNLTKNSQDKVLVEDICHRCDRSKLSSIWCTESRYLRVFCRIFDKGISIFPSPSVDLDYLLMESRESKNYSRLMYEYYKYTAQLAQFVLRIDHKSDSVKNIKIEHYAIFVGLLNRISRLMLSNLQLSSGGNGGETTSIIDRCINESCVKLMWLCEQNTSDAFIRFISDGLERDLKFREQIETNINNRNGNILPVENRMLSSIADYILDSGLTEEQIRNAKKLPNFSSLLDNIDFNKTYYPTIMNIGSHSVHGSWSSLKKDFVSIENGEIKPKDHVSRTSVNQYISVAIMVLNTLKVFIEYILNDDDPSFSENFIALCDELISSVEQIFIEIEAAGTG